MRRGHVGDVAANFEIKYHRSGAKPLNFRRSCAPISHQHPRDLAMPSGVDVEGELKQPVIFTVVAATWIAIAPAQAQPVAADLLPSYEVATIVASMGMRPLDRPIWRHGRYTVTAIDRYGREVRVILDARDGQVIAVRPLTRDHGYEPRYAPPPPPAYPRSGPYDPRYEAPPSPPAAVPGGPAIDDDDEFYDDDRLEGSLRPPSVPRIVPAPREVTTGSMPPRTTSLAPSKSRSGVERGNESNKDASPLPRPRPAVASAKPVGPKSADPKTTGSIGAAAGPLDKSAGEKPASKPDSKEASAVKPDDNTKAAPNKTEAPKADIRVIDMSKPKSDEKPEDKPGEAIRF